jgi:hypothetical protein
MAKRSGPLQYTLVQPTDTDFTLLEELSLKVVGYVVTYFNIGTPAAPRAVFGVYKNFMRAFRECKALTPGLSPRCFVLGLVAGAKKWFAVNPAKMPH